MFAFSNFFRVSRESCRRVLVAGVRPVLLLIHVRRKYESVSTVRWEISRSTAIFNPKVRAQTSAMLFAAYPIFFANAHISSPLWLRITPLIPVGPGLCLDAPSMFNLNHPCGGWFLL